MEQVYIIPDIRETKKSISLINEFKGAFEFNDFWVPSVLDDRRKQEEIIEHYAKYRTDFSKDTMHGAFLDITVHSEDPIIREASIKRIYQSMDIAKRMNLRGVIFHTGILSGFRLTGYLEHWKKANVEFFTELAYEYPEQNIYIENMFDSVPSEIAALGEAMKDIDNFGLCMDYAHAAVSNCPLEKWVSELAPYIRHMHINDNDLNNDLHQPVGDGKIDWMEFNSLMEKYKVDATVLVEVKGFDEQKKSLQYLNEQKIFPLNR